MTIDFEALDPGIRETVRWISDLNFTTTDSGDGVSKFKDGEESPPEYALPFPHVVIKTSYSSMTTDCLALKYRLKAIGIEVVPTSLDQGGVSIELSYDVGSGIATILVSGLNDKLLLEKLSVYS